MIALRSLALAGLAAASMIDPAILLSAQGLGPSFEVASVKRSAQPCCKNVFMEWRGNTWIASEQSVMALIRTAYGLQPRGQVLNAPRWVDVDRFTIVAKAEKIPSANETRIMMQALLADRFRLAVHRETKEAPADVLTVARSDGALGRQLRVIDTDCTAVQDARVRGDAPTPAPVADPNQPPPACTQRLLVQGAKLQYESEGSTMAQLIRIIAEDRPIVDHTGISGHVAYKLEFAYETPLTPTPDLTSSDVPTLRTALLEQLGLRMETGRGPVEVLVIDRVEPPTEN